MSAPVDLVVLAVTADLRPDESRRHRMAYRSVKACARQRGIRFTFTFEHQLAWARQRMATEFHPMLSVMAKGLARQVSRFSHADVPHTASEA